MSELAAKIQDSELEVMRVLWEAEEDALPLREIRQTLADRCGWEYSTVKTLLHRLQNKGVVRLESRGVYGAIVSEDNYNRWSARSLVNKVFAGSAKKLMAALVSDGQLGEDDIAELSDLLNKGVQP